MLTPQQEQIMGQLYQQHVGASNPNTVVNPANTSASQINPPMPGTNPTDQSIPGQPAQQPYSKNLLNYILSGLGTGLGAAVDIGGSVAGAPETGGASLAGLAAEPLLSAGGANIGDAAANGIRSLFGDKSVNIGNTLGNVPGDTLSGLLAPGVSKVLGSLFNPITAVTKGLVQPLTDTASGGVNFGETGGIFDQLQNAISSQDKYLANPNDSQAALDNIKTGITNLLNKGAVPAEEDMGQGNALSLAASPSRAYQIRQGVGNLVNWSNPSLNQSISGSLNKDLYSMINDQLYQGNPALQSANGLSHILQLMGGSNTGRIAAGDVPVGKLTATLASKPLGISPMIGRTLLPNLIKKLIGAPGALFPYAGPQGFIDQGPMQGLLNMLTQSGSPIGQGIAQSALSGGLNPGGPGVGVQGLQQLSQ